MLQSFLSLLFLPFLFGLLLTVVMFVLKLARKPVTSPSCGKCGYEVAGLEVLRCPECGGDLREVGINTPSVTARLTPRARARLFALAWTACIPYPAAMLTFMVDRSLPNGYEHFSQVTLQPGFAGYADVHIAFLGIGGVARRGYDEVEVTLRKTDGTSSLALEADLAKGTCRIEQADGSWREHDGPVDVDRVAEWMTAAADLGDGSYAGRAGAVMGIIQSVPRSGAAMTRSFFNSTSMSSGSRRVPRPWFMPTAVVVWGSIWLIGVGLILRRRRAG
jgi:hypothetical protein